jgi:hypothetical protein
MTLAAGLMAAKLRAAARECLAGVASTTAAAAVAAVVSAIAAGALAIALPDGGIASSVGATALVGATCLLVFAVVACRLDRMSTLLLLQTVRRAR